MDWFRVYSSILDKPKFARMSPADIGYWVLFAAAASRRTPRGTLPDDVDELALMIHRPSADTRDALKRLRAAGLIETIDGLTWLHKWREYQPPSTERTRKLRGLTDAEPPPKPPPKRRPPKTRPRPELTPEQCEALKRGANGNAAIGTPANKHRD